MPNLTDSKYDFADNTFTAKEQSFAICEVGDAKQEDVFGYEVNREQVKEAA